MILRIFGFENPIDFSESNVYVIEIENPTYLGKLMLSLKQEAFIGVSNESFILYENDTRFDISKYVSVITDIFSIELNERNILKALYHSIENRYLQESEIKQSVEQHLQETIVLLQNIFSEYEFEIDYTPIVEIQSFLKLIQCKIGIEKIESPLDIVLSYIDIVSEFSIYKIIVFANLKLYFTEKEILEIYKYAQYKQLFILLLEPYTNKALLSGEKKIHIDINYDEFLLE